MYIQNLFGVVFGMLIKERNDQKKQEKKNKKLFESK